MSMRLKKIGDWIQYITEKGQTFYYNDKSGEFQWVNPEEAGLDSGAKDAHMGDWKPYKVRGFYGLPWVVFVCNYFICDKTLRAFFRVWLGQRVMQYLFLH